MGVRVAKAPFPPMAPQGPTPWAHRPLGLGAVRRLAAVAVSADRPGRSRGWGDARPGPLDPAVRPLAAAVFRPKRRGDERLLRRQRASDALANLSVATVGNTIP